MKKTDLTLLKKSFFCALFAIMAGLGALLVPGSAQAHHPTISAAGTVIIDQALATGYTVAFNEVRRDMRPAPVGAVDVFSVYIGSWHSKYHAKKVANRIRRHGIDAYVKKGYRKNGAKVFRVTAGDFMRRKRAVRLKRRLHTELGFNNMSIIRRR